MTDIKEPINNISDGTFLSGVCENPEKSVVYQKLGGRSPPSPPGITSLLGAFKHKKEQLTAIKAVYEGRA